MAVGDTKAMAASFIISGSTVAIVGAIFMITITWAFMGMLAFGSIMVVVGVLISIRETAPGSGRGDEPGEPS